MLKKKQKPRKKRKLFGEKQNQKKRRKEKNPFCLALLFGLGIVSFWMWCCFHFFQQSYNSIVS